MPSSQNDALAAEKPQPVDPWVTRRFLANSVEAKDPLVAAVLVLAEAVRESDTNRKAKQQLDAICSSLGIPKGS